MTTLRFRTLVVTWGLLYGWWSFLPLTAYKQPTVVQQALEHAGRGAVIPLNDSLANTILAATIAAAIGLLTFHRWARWLLLITTLFSLVQAPFAGVMVAGPVDGTLGFAVTLLTGVLLAVAFWSSVAKRFETVAPVGSSSQHHDEVEQAPDTRLIPVFATSDAAVVPVVHSVLESAGIEYTTTSENLQDLVAGGRLAGFNPATGSVRFLVREEDAVVAKDLIELETRRDICD